MSRRLALLVFVVILFLPSLSLASQIDSHDMQVFLSPEGWGDVNVTIKYEELTTAEVFYQVHNRPDDIQGFDSQGELDCAVRQLASGWQVSCKPGVETPSDNYTVTMAFRMHDLQRRAGDAVMFSYQHDVITPTSRLRLYIVLPEGRGLVQEEATTPFFPPTATVGSTGRRISLEWDETGLELGKTYLFTATYEKVISDLTSLVLALSALGLAGFASAWYRKRSQVKTVLSVLKPDEKKVMDIIMDEKNGCNQKKVVRDTDFSKAKVSRIIADLENRGLIEKERKGRANIIKMSEKTIK